MFNDKIAAAFSALVIIQIGCSAWEGTFMRNQDRHLATPMIWHWGCMVGDLIILPIVFGLVFTYFKNDPQPWAPSLWIRLIIWALVSISLTWQMHKLWWPLLGHIVPDHSASDGNSAHGT